MTTTTLKNGTLFTTAVLMSLTGCHAHHGGHHHRGSDAGVVRQPDSPDADAEVLRVLSSLAGEWEMQGEDGKMMPASVFTVTAAGSAVREIMFPGEAHEMTNLYHLDGGDTVVCTHYCAAGNQPRMVADGMTQMPDGPGFDFRIDSVSNLRESHDHYMGSLKLVMVDDNTLHEVWSSLDRDGKPSGDPMIFVLKRKQAD